MEEVFIVIEITEDDMGIIGVFSSEEGAKAKKKECESRIYQEYGYDPYFYTIEKYKVSR